MKQAQVLRALFDRRVWSAYGASMSEDDFDDVHVDVFRLIKRFYKKYPNKERIRKGSLRLLGAATALRAVESVKLPVDIDVVLEGVREHALNMSIVGVVSEFAKEHAEGTINLDALLSDLNDVRRSFSTRETGHNITRTSFWDMYRPENLEHAFPLPVRELTARLDGGPCAGELLTVIAGTDIGKTMFLINAARHATECGMRIVYVTLETTAHNWSQRYWCSVMSRKFSTVLRNIDTYEDTYKQWLKAQGGELHFVDASDKELKVADIHRIAERMIEQQGPIDGIIVDYGDLVRSAHHYNSTRDEQREVWKELRRVAKVLNCPIITASQLNRLGAGAKQAELIHVAECWSKATDSDIVMLVQRSEYEKQRHTANVKILKTKKSGGYASVECLFNTARCRVE